ncbi:hypothetical protein HU200_046161 [Digitaria exilis]|uniref:DUF6598 domain-containing protein n=1 Tax=Digitaria exilis TaxID=1010633 RepID=A0A835ECP8_9POAL|nr:hypothetical protein HU200_046161 [Digitaria exilis]
MEPAWSGSEAMTGKKQDHGTMSSPREDGRNLRHISSPREEDRHGTEIEEDCGEGEDIVVTKKQCVEEDEEQVVGGLKEFRKFWEESMSPHFGPLTATTGMYTTGSESGPMRYTDSGPPSFGGIPYDALEIFSIKVTELKGFEWPIRVFGLVAVRDSMDHKRNVLFDRSEEDSQTLTEKDSSLVLTGPTRAIALIDPPEFEVELRILGSRPSGGKILSAVYFEYTNRNSASTGLVQTWTERSKRSKIEVKCSQLNAPLEATIELCHLEGSVDFHGQFYAHMEHMGEEHIVLLDSRDDKVTLKPDGHVMLSRKVVLVEEGARLVLGVKAWQNGDVDSAVVDTAVFPARFHSRSNGCFDVGFCKMSISVAWSVLC